MRLLHHNARFYLQRKEEKYRDVTTLAPASPPLPPSLGCPLPVVVAAVAAVAVAVF
jgi:hypothetical protein